MFSARLAAATIALLMSVAGSLEAQNEKPPPPPSEFTADLGFVSITGNTSTLTFALDEKWIRRMSKWEFRQDLGAVYGETDGEESSNLWRAALRADRVLAEHLALYGRGTYDQNKFGGIDSRFGEGLGVVWRALVNDVNQLNVEGGFELVQQNNLDGTSDNFTALRLASTWKHVFSEKAYFYQEVEYLPNLDIGEDYRLNTETTLGAPISERIAIKASYKVRFDNLPSLNATGTAPLQKSDRIFSTGLQITF